MFSLFFAKVAAGLAAATIAAPGNTPAQAQTPESGVLKTGDAYGDVFIPGTGYGKKQLRFKVRELPVIKGKHLRMLREQEQTILGQGCGHVPQSGSPALRNGKFPKKMFGTVAIFCHDVTSIRSWMAGGPMFHAPEWQKGDLITLKMWYGTFRYRIVGHEIVSKYAWNHFTGDSKVGVLKMADCWPQQTSNQRWVVTAKLVKWQLHLQQS